ncbi:hypothetical protein M9Y10_033703 [Tritrichomonas musculus]|uniref:Ubiquitin-like protein ATG12 n=1 Tax=Tritrichomonas musculus TaxID=1915356 RepID=A0ABR2KEU9_9EUKA
MSVGGLFQPNKVSNAYACCCQFLSRIKPVVENSVKSLSIFSPDSIEFQYHAALIDIYSQIKEGSNDIDIFPFIHICSHDIPITTDFIKLIKSALIYYDPKSQSDNGYFSNVFYSSILSNSIIKFIKSSVFDFKLSDMNLNDCITSEYDHFSDKPNVFLFHPTNQSKFNLYFFLEMTNYETQYYFSLFAFVISKYNNPSHYILYISQSSNNTLNWISIDDDQISICPFESLKELSHSDENIFIMFAFGENIEDIYEPLNTELLDIPKIDLDSILVDDIPPSSPSFEQQISSSLSSSSQFTTPSKSQILEQSSKNSSPNDNFELISKTHQKCKVTLELLSTQKMEFEEVFNEENNYDDIKLEISQFIKKNRISQYFFTFKFENHKKFHRHIKFDDEIIGYLQKKDDPQILADYIKSYRIDIKFVCKEIKIFNTKAAFHSDQCAKALYDFCSTLLNEVLGIRAKKIKLFLNNNKKLEETNATPLYQLFKLLNPSDEKIIYFSYQE